MRHDSAHDILHSHAAVHDRTQFEVQFTYDISAGNISQRKDHERYRIEAFYFFPTALGVTSLSFPKDDFYRSLRAYIRFKTPDLSEADLLDPLNRKSPLNVLSFTLKRLGEGEDAELDAVNEARLFGCIVSRLLKYNRKEIHRLIARVRHRPADERRWGELVGALDGFLAGTAQLLGKYRTIVTDLQALAPMRVPHLRQVDEYLTYRFDEVVTAIHFALTSLPESHARSHAILSQVLAVADREAVYRRQMGYITLAPGDEAGLALYTYRSSALKKQVERVLYLDVKSIQETNRWRNLAAMAAAMVAALFADQSNRRMVIPFYTSHLYLAIALVGIFYVIKDRIKELMREYVWQRVSKLFPDVRHLIHDPVKRIDLGGCKERVRHLAKKDVASDVLQVRNFNHTIDIDEEREETVIVYQNDVVLNARKILGEHQRRTDIKHILRFSIEDLLSRLDDPTIPVQFFDPSDASFRRVRAPKVYHLNVVFRFTRWDDQNRKVAPHYQRVRVILDKNGIQRVEPVLEVCGTGELPALGVKPHEAPAIHDAVV